MPKLKLVTRICRGCGKTESGPSRKILGPYCSKECWRVGAAGQHLKTGKAIVCPNCKKSHYRRGSHLEKGAKWCSMACYNEARAKVSLTCPTCGDAFPRRNKTSQFCSYACSKLGGRNPAYSTGHTRKIREWKEAVLASGENRCAACGVTGEIACHHKDGTMLRPERRYDPTNGACLCSRCHRRLHSLFGALCTENDFAEFLEKWSTRKEENRVG